jgi:CHASE2 domain-containing sensor protein
MDMQAASALGIGVVVTLFVPALVWTTVVTGLLQMAQKKARSSVESSSPSSCRQRIPC